MKYIILVTVSALAIVTGRMLASKYKKRVIILENILSFIAYIGTRIEYAIPLGEIINDYIGNGQSQLAFLENVLRLKDEGADFHSAWEQALMESKSEFFGQDYKLLLAFGTDLGSTDIEGQKSLCNMYSSLISENLAQAKIESRSKGSLFGKLGIFSALFIAVIFI